MKQIKYIIILVIIISASVLAFFNQKALAQVAHKLYYYSICNTPVTYHIGSIDPRFRINQEDFLQDTKQAIATWNNAYPKPLLIYDPKGTVTVNLIYDQRQSMNTQINSLQSQLNNEKQNLDPQIQEYKNLEADFKQKLDALNAEILSWNNQGGAPPDVYEQLTQKQQELKDEATKLNQLAKQLNQSTDVYNTQVSQLNQTVQNFNQALTLRPEEGLYNGKDNTISIYFATTQDELIHTLTHEFGHAIGLGHVNDPNAIMYAYTTKTLSLSNADLQELHDLCRERSIVEIMGEEFAIIGQNMQHSIQVITQK